MLRYLTLIIMGLVSLHTTALNTVQADPYIDFLATEIERLELEIELFDVPMGTEEAVSIATIAVYEIDEDITFGFNTAERLPVGFDAREGMNDIDWNKAELFDLAEDIDLGFDTSKYLPADFDPKKGLNDLDWNTIELFELEEELEIGFDTKTFLPEGFDPYLGMECEVTTEISYDY